MHFFFLVFHSSTYIGFRNVGKVETSFRRQKFKSGIKAVNFHTENFSYENVNTAFYVSMSTKLKMTALIKCLTKNVQNINYWTKIICGSDTYCGVFQRRGGAYTKLIYLFNENILNIYTKITRVKFNNNTNTQIKVWTNMCTYLGTFSPLYFQTIN